MKAPSVPANQYSPEELRVMVTGMQVAAERFYIAAVRIQYHQFVELAGFMNQMVTICEHELAEGRDFATNDIELEDHQAFYLGEKLGCIFGAALRNPEVWAAFVAGVRKG